MCKYINIYQYIYIYTYMVPPPPPPVIHAFSASFVFFLFGHCVFLFVVRDLFSLSQRADLYSLSFLISGCLSICLYCNSRDRYKPVQIGTSCTGPGPLEPRTKNQDCGEVLPCNLGSWFLVPWGRYNLYRFVPVCTGLYVVETYGRYKPVQIGTSCTGPREPRTKNQDCRARPPCNLGSWFLVPGAGPVQLVALCTGLYRPVCLDKFKDFKGFRTFKWAGPFPKIAILSQNFKDLRNLRVLKKFKWAGPFPK